MMKKATEAKDDGRVVDHVGLPICEGPSNYRMMITWPVTEEGHIVEIPLENLERVEDVVQEARGDKPTVVDE